MSRCIRCNSIWVCWNWCSDKEGALHECWNCAASWLTPEKEKNGIPYWALRYIGKHFVDHELFEKNFAKDMSELHSLMEDAPWDDPWE